MSPLLLSKNRLPSFLWYRAGYLTPTGFEYLHHAATVPHSPGNVKAGITAGMVFNITCPDEPCAYDRLLFRGCRETLFKHVSLDKDESIACQSSHGSKSPDLQAQAKEVPSKHRHPSWITARLALRDLLRCPSSMDKLRRPNKMGSDEES